MSEQTRDMVVLVVILVVAVLVGFYWPFGGEGIDPLGRY